jgi:lipopolysaccharide export LptBFGC system permease protein LptF
MSGVQRASTAIPPNATSPKLDAQSAPGVPAVRRGVYLAEANNRLSAPLYCIAFALIALAATTKGRMARASYALRLSGAALMGATLRLVGYAAQGLAARSPQFNFILYLLPLRNPRAAGRASPLCQPGWRLSANPPPRSRRPGC